MFGWLRRKKTDRAPIVMVPNRVSKPNEYPDRVRWIGDRWRTPAEWIRDAMGMLAEDPKITGYASALRHSILSARWTVDVASDCDEARAAAELVRDALGLDGHPCHLASGSLENEIAKVVDFALFGRYVVEEIWTTDGDGRTWLYGLGDIDQRTIHREIRDQQTAILTGFEQIPDAGLASVIIPSTKTQVYSYRATGDETLGVGLLRPCVVWFELKRSLVDSLDAGTRRWAIPTPQITFDRDLLRSIYTDTEIKQFSESVSQWAADYIAGQTGFVQAPAGINLTLFGGSFDPQRLISAIQTCDQEISAAFLENWQELGVGDVGSRSVGEIQWNAYKASIANYLDAIANVWNGPNRPGGGTICRFLQQTMFDGREIPPEILPRLRHRGVTVDAFADLIGVLPQLVAANLVTPTDDLETRIRREFGAEQPSPARPNRLDTAEGQPVSIQPRIDQGGRPELTELGT